MAEKFSKENLWANDNEQARIDLFQTQLAEICDTRISTIELYTESQSPVDEAIKAFQSYDMPPVPTLFLNDGFQTMMTESDARFTPRVARGQRSSAHGVFFGDITFGNHQRVGIAVKPHVIDQTISCLRDYFNTKLVRQLGIDGLEPVGFMIQEGWPAYSLTRLDEGLTTLDSINWSHFFDEFTEEQGMLDIWLRTARQLAFVHSIGSIAHGDVAARNIAVTNEGNVFLIDWERSHISLKEPRDAEVRYSRSHLDTASLLESMWFPPESDFKAGIGLFFGRPAESTWQVFKTIFLDEYIEYRLAFAAENGKHNHQQKLEVAEELKVLQQSLREDHMMYAANLGQQE